MQPIYAFICTYTHMRTCTNIYLYTYACSFVCVKLILCRLILTRTCNVLSKLNRFLKAENW